MSDWSELKRLAEAASFGDWHADQLAVTADTRALVCCGRAHLECCGDPDVDGDEFDPVCTATAEPFASFIAAASPGIVMALIAENERNQERADAEAESFDSQRRVLDRVKAERDQLRAEVDELRMLLSDAADEIGEWGAYASEYFQEKHDLVGCVAKFRDALRKVKGND